MKKITLKFLTDNGINAYREIQKTKSKLKDRMIVNALFTDKEISKDPLIIEINIKMSWMAVKIELDKQVIEGLKQKGAVKDIDYKIEVD